MGGSTRSKGVRKVYSDVDGIFFRGGISNKKKSGVLSGEE